MYNLSLVPIGITRIQTIHPPEDITSSSTVSVSTVVIPTTRPNLHHQSSTDSSTSIVNIDPSITTKTIVLSPATLPLISTPKSTSIPTVSASSLTIVKPMPTIVHVEQYKPNKPQIIASLGGESKSQQQHISKTTLATATITATPTKTIGGGTGHIVKGKRINSTSTTTTTSTSSTSMIRNFRLFLEHNYANKFILMTKQRY